MKNLIALSVVLTLAWSCNGQQVIEEKQTMEDFDIEKTDQEWKAQLTPEQFYVLRNKGTERPGTGEYNLHFEDGTYHCAACNAALFASEAKFESSCGWPSFDKALGENTVVEILDTSHGMTRTEIVCASCGGHLGHVFNDGPTETGVRYCINSVSLGFDDENAVEEKEDNATKE